MNRQSRNPVAKKTSNKSTKIKVTIEYHCVHLTSQSVNRNKNVLVGYASGRNWAAANTIEKNLAS